MTDYTADVTQRGITTDAAIGQRNGHYARVRGQQKRAALNNTGLRRCPGHPQAAGREAQPIRGRQPARAAPAELTARDKIAGALISALRRPPAGNGRWNKPAKRLSKHSASAMRWVMGRRRRSRREHRGTAARGAAAHLLKQSKTPNSLVTQGGIGPPTNPASWVASHQGRVRFIARVTHSASSASYICARRERFRSHVQAQGAFEPTADRTAQAMGGRGSRQHPRQPRQACT